GAEALPDSRCRPGDGPARVSDLSADDASGAAGRVGPGRGSEPAAPEGLGPPRAGVPSPEPVPHGACRVAVPAARDGGDGAVHAEGRIGRGRVSLSSSPSLISTRRAGGGRHPIT